MIENVKEYAAQINASDEVMCWLDTTGAKSARLQKVSLSELEHIVDYLVSSQAPRRLRRLSIVDAKRKAKEWSDRNKRKGRNLEDSCEDIEVIHDFEDGSMIVKLLTDNAFKREGFLMSHCLGGYTFNDSEYDIYSYRDEKNMPHATFEVRKNSDEVVQIKGKGNGAIHPRYIEPILIFLEVLGINIRTSEMKNLGYYHIDESLVGFIANFDELSDKLVDVRGEKYVV